MFQHSVFVDDQVDLKQILNRAESIVGTEYTLMSDYITAWQCIGCGKIEAPQPCIGVCRDRKVLLVSLDEHKQALDQVQQLLSHLDAMHGVVSRLAHSTPRPGHWEKSWLALQDTARATLAAIEHDADNGLAQ